MTTKTNGIASKGDVLTYEDQANPRTSYIVTEQHTTDYGIQYSLLNLETGEKVYSDCRQFGWTTWINLNVATGLSI